MKRILAMAMAVITSSFLQAMPVQKGWKQICTYTSHDTEHLFQGLLYKDGELFQCFDGGVVNILDAETFAFKRSFQLPYHGHYSTVEWLDKSRFATTDYECNLYITDISDESKMTCDSIHMSALNPAFFTKMAALAYDKANKRLYVSGYAPDKNFRRDVVTSVLDLSGYMAGTSREMPLIDEWTVPSYHIQDGCFYNGLIWHLLDKTIGQTGVPWDCLAVYALDPATKAIKARMEIPLEKFREAQALSVFKDRIILSDVADKKHCRYYRIDMDLSGKQPGEEQLLSPLNPARNALCCGYGLYDFTSEKVNRPAPKGYEPFYMVHYGRHGARYLSESSDYELLHDVFSSVPDEEFTPIGRVLAARYESVYPELKDRVGDLSGIGKRELALLGKRYVKSFPEIFRRGSNVLAECSKVPRCIVSASYFCDVLDDIGCNVNLNVNGAIADSMIRRKWYPSERDSYTDSLLRKRVDVKGICDRLFKNGVNAIPSDATGFVKILWKLACDMPLTDYPDVAFTSAFSYKDLLALKSVQDDMYRFGRRPENSVETEYSRVLLNHMMEVAREDIVGGDKVSARLFFGHDTPLMSLMCLLGPEGWAAGWSTSDIPVAANLRFVFYRRGGDVIYKVQLNESDVTGYIKFPPSPNQ